MSDAFSRVCMILVVCLLAVIAFRQAPQPPYVPDMKSTPGYKVIEVAPDANQINEILSKYALEGAFELAGAPVYKQGKPGSEPKLILILVHHL